MFTLINDFCNYDNVEYEKNENISNTIQIDDKKLTSNFNYQIIANFSDQIPQNILLSEEHLKISTMIPSKQFVDDILKSYLCNRQIKHQFIMDIRRGKLLINGNKIKSPITALNYLKYTHRKQYPRLIVCATQATCASAFEWIYNSLPEDYHLSELKHGRQKKSVISIQGNTVTYNKGLRIFKLVDGDDHTLYKVLLMITIDDAIYNKGDVTIEVDIIPI